MKSNQWKAKVLQRVLEKLEKRGMIMQRSSIPEAVHALSRYMEADDRAYLNRKGQLVIESDGGSHAEAQRRLSMVLRQVRQGAENVGLELHPDLRPTTYREQDANIYVAVATFDLGSVREATEQELDAAARGAGFTKNRDGWVIDERRSGGPYGLAYALVIPEKGGLRWSVMDRIGKSMGTGFETSGPSVFSKVKRLYDQGKRRPGEVPDRTLASAQEQDVPPQYRKAGYEVYDAQGNYEGYTADLDEAIDHAERAVGKGAKVVDAKNRSSVVHRVESVWEASSRNQFETTADLLKAYGATWNDVQQHSSGLVGLKNKETGQWDWFRGGTRGWTKSGSTRNKSGRDMMSLTRSREASSMNTALLQSIIRDRSKLNDSQAAHDAVKQFIREENPPAELKDDLERSVLTHNFDNYPGDGARLLKWIIQKIDRGVYEAQVSERPFRQMDAREAHQRRPSRNQFGTGPTRARARKHILESLSWTQHGDKNWIARYQGWEFVVVRKGNQYSVTSFDPGSGEHPFLGHHASLEDATSAVEAFVRRGFRK